MAKRRTRYLLIRSLLIAALGISFAGTPLVDAAECSFGPYTGRCRDIGLMRSVKGDAEKRTSARSILWVEAGYLSADEASDLHRRIDKGIEAVEKFLGLPFSREAYGQEKIEFFVHGRTRAFAHHHGLQPAKIHAPRRVPLLRQRRENALSA